MRRFNPETDRPFVIGALAHDHHGEMFLVPAGVVIAAEEDEALEMAIVRWPSYTIATPMKWESVAPEHRLMALDADRQIALERPARLR